MGVTQDLDIRRRRALYRATHRGTKEMDVLLGRYAEAVLPGLDAGGLEQLERLLTLPDPDLQGWILGGKSVSEDEFTDAIAAMRRFHKLDPA